MSVPMKRALRSLDPIGRAALLAGLTEVTERQLARIRDVRPDVPTRSLVPEDFEEGQFTDTAGRLFVPAVDFQRWQSHLARTLPQTMDSAEIVPFHVFWDFYTEGWPGRCWYLEDSPLADCEDDDGNPLRGAHEQVRLGDIGYLGWQGDSGIMRRGEMVPALAFFEDWRREAGCLDGQVDRRTLAVSVPLGEIERLRRFVEEELGGEVAANANGMPALAP